MNIRFCKTCSYHIGNEGMDIVKKLVLGQKYKESNTYNASNKLERYFVTFSSTGNKKCIYKKTNLLGHNIFSRKKIELTIEEALYLKNQ